MFIRHSESKMETIAQRIKKYRVARGWTKEQAAVKLEVGYRNYVKIEQEGNLTIKRLYKLAHLFRVPVAKLLTMDDLEAKDSDEMIMTNLKDKIAKTEQEIIRLQIKLIGLYERAREN
jgi:transcriptional regulator with XRE-family HTH domain